MRKFNASWAALVVSGCALFTALGGPAWASSLISGKQIKNGSISSRKIGHGQIKQVNLASGSVHTKNLANNAVTTSKIAGGAVTSANVAPNTFLAANGTATNSNELGGKLASSFIGGTGNVLQNRITVPAGTSGQFLLDVGLGEIDGSCLSPGGKPQVSFTAEVAPINLIEWANTFGGTSDVNTTNGLTVGNTYDEPNSSGLPQAVEFQAAESNSTTNHIATAWTTGQDIGTTSCIFTAQAVTTGP